MCVHKGLPGRGRVHRPEFMLQNGIDAGHMHVVTRHSASAEISDLALLMMTNVIRISTVIKELGVRKQRNCFG